LRKLPNSNFSSQIALNKAESLQIGIKNAKLETPGTACVGAQQFPTKKQL